MQIAHGLSPCRRTLLVAPTSHPRIVVIVQARITYGRGIFRGIADYARAHERWQLVTAEPAAWNELDRPLSGVTGVIAQIMGDDLEAQLMSLDVPVVNVSASRQGADLPTVIPDNEAVGRLAAEHMLELGLRHYVYLHTCSHHSSTLRGESFDRRLRDAGRTCTWVEMVDGESFETALLEQPRPLGLMAFNDTRASMAIDACLNNGLKVPEDVAVIGVDNDDLFCEVTQPPMSSVDVDPEQLGYRAAELLAQLLAGEAGLTEPILIPPRGVVARQSTDTMAMDDPDLVDALRFIRANAEKPIQVEDVLQHVPIARRALEQRFRKLLGRTPAAEIRRVHVEAAKSLLAQTDLSIPDVARRSGFRYAAHMAQVFRKATGQTPTDYRNRFRRT